ncbi:MAG: hypothetical protein F6K21_05530 [Symploca sp. SIO2D2]|nr:hypothetical protein [Symploca sp. SIO2D2]
MWRDSTEQWYYSLGITEKESAQWFSDQAVRDFSVHDSRSPDAKEPGVNMAEMDEGEWKECHSYINCADVLNLEEADFDY